MKKLSVDERLAIARNRNTDSKTLSMLAKDEVAEVRWCVAKNPNTSVETLSELAKDEAAEVR